MTFALCPLSVVPLRSSASGKSELLSQLLFGELVELIDRKGKQWVQVRCHHDNFVGWVAANQLQLITPSEFEHYQAHFSFNLELLHPVMGEDHFLPIVMGGRLPEFDGLRFQLGGQQYTFSGQSYTPGAVPATAEFIAKIARRYLHAPYMQGGRSPLGIDSAGLTQIVLQIAGFQLPREAHQQVESGDTVDFIEQVLPGDLAFFENRTGRITHTGIVLPDLQILHAYGKVRIDRLDHYGIFNLEEEKYTHRLRILKRILPPLAPPSQPAETNEEPTPEQMELFK